MDAAARFGIELACQRLAYQFCYLSDRLRHEEYADLFASDGIFSRPGLEAQGRVEILEALRRRPESLKTRHLCTNVIIDVADSAHASGTGTALLVTHDVPSKTTQTPVVVDFTDDYVLTGEGWKIARRIVVHAF